MVAAAAAAAAARPAAPRPALLGLAPNRTLHAPPPQGHHHKHKHHHGRHGAEAEEVTCEDVSDLDPRSDDRCAFVRAHCKSQSLIDYPKLYYCHVARHTWLTAAMLVGVG